LPVTRSSATVSVAPFDHFTVIEAGAWTSCMSVITKCHSAESHSWSFRVLAFTLIVIVPPPVVVDVLVLPPVVVDVPVLPPVVVDVLVPVEVAVDVPVVVPVEVVVPVDVPAVVVVDVPVVVPVVVPVDVPVLVDVPVAVPVEVPVEVPVVVPDVPQFTLKTLWLSPPGVIPLVCLTDSLYWPSGNFCRG